MLWTLPPFLLPHLLWHSHMCCFLSLFSVGTLSTLVPFLSAFKAAYCFSFFSLYFLSFYFYSTLYHFTQQHLISILRNRYPLPFLFLVSAVTGQVPKLLILVVTPQANFLQKITFDTLYTNRFLIRICSRTLSIILRT